MGSGYAIRLSSITWLWRRSELNEKSFLLADFIELGLAFLGPECSSASEWEVWKGRTPPDAFGTWMSISCVSTTMVGSAFSLISWVTDGEFISF